MAKNPSPAGSSATNLAAAAAVDKSSSAAAGSNVLKDATRAASVDDAGAEPEATSVTTISFKLDVKSASSAAAASAAVTTSETQATSKQRKLNTPSPPPPEEDNIDLKCLLLADTTLQCAPQHLRQMLQHVEDQTATTAPEILLLLIYCVALEAGFMTRSEFTKYKDIIMRLAPTSSYHSKNVLRISRQVPTYIANDNKEQLVMQLRNIVNVATNGTQPTLLDSLLTCLVTGDFLIVTHTPDRTTNIPGRSICLSIGRYVLNAHPKGKQLFQCFRKLDELSRLLRENIFVPVRNGQLEAMTISVFPALLGMPAELYENIFKYLSQNQLKILANVNKQLNYLSTRSKYYL